MFTHTLSQFFMAKKFCKVSLNDRIEFFHLLKTSDKTIIVHFTDQNYLEISLKMQISLFVCHTSSVNGLVYRYIYISICIWAVIIWTIGTVACVHFA